MKNYEKYADEIRNIKSQIGWCDSFAKPKILAPIGKSCGNTACGQCSVLTLMWLLEDYKEPEVDWSKVEVDTPILVRNDDYATAAWLRRYFAEYDDGVVYAWNCGCTSWSETVMTPWQYAKLAESEEE